MLFLFLILGLFLHCDAANYGRKKQLQNQNNESKVTTPQPDDQTTQEQSDISVDSPPSTQEQSDISEESSPSPIELEGQLSNTPSIVSKLPEDKTPMFAPNENEDQDLQMNQLHNIEKDKKKKINWIPLHNTNKNINQKETPSLQIKSGLQIYKNSLNQNGIKPARTNFINSKFQNFDAQPPYKQLTGNYYLQSNSHKQQATIQINKNMVQQANPYTNTWIPGAGFIPGFPYTYMRDSYGGHLPPDVSYNSDVESIFDYNYYRPNQYGTLQTTAAIHINIPSKDDDVVYFQ